MEEKDLLKCPWCGELPTLTEYNNQYAFHCGSDEDGHYAETAFYNTEAEAVAAWNKRY